MVRNFDFYLPVRIKFGLGTIDTLGEECSRLGKGNVMLVVDQNLVGTDAFEKAVSSLSKAGIKSAIFSDFTPDPDEECIKRGLAELHQQKCEALVGFGGGSAMDTARAIAISATITGQIKQYEGINTLNAPVLPLINIPTTAGTGSEVSSATIITSNVEKRKYMVKSPYAFAKAAILDPVTLATLPKSVAASAGMDAIIHAVESYISRNSSPMSDMFATTGLRLASKSIRDFVADRSNLEAATDMLLASMLAAISMSQAGLGVVHALANTLGGRFHSPHGLTCALLLCDCLDDMTGAAVEKFANMTIIIAPEAKYNTEVEYAEHLPDILRRLLADLEVETGLNKLGVTEDDIRTIVEYTPAGIVAISPREFTFEDMIQIIKRAL